MGEIPGFVGRPGFAGATSIPWKMFHIKGRQAPFVLME
jgi:hypothetical protein